MTPGKLIRKIDYQTVIIFLVLVFFGWMNIFSSSYSNSEMSAFDLDLRAGKQLIWIFVSLFLIIPLLFVETHIISFFSNFIYGFVIFLLIAVLMYGTTVNESRSWFQFMGIRVQPAEFSKFATALALSKFMGNEKFSFQNIKDTLTAGAIVISPALLILLQNDTGSAMVFAAFLLVFYREGLHYIFLFLAFFFTALFIVSFYFYNIWIFIMLSFILFGIFAYRKRKWAVFWNMLAVFTTVILSFLFIVVFFFVNIPNLWIIIIACSISIAVYFLKYVKIKFFTISFIVFLYYTAIFFVMSVNYIFENLLSDYQQDRVEVFLGLLDDPKGVGYNVHQSEIAIGSGGLWGKGFLKGTQTKFDFVPEQDTDFIFCTIGEEWGFMGSTFLIVMFSLLIIRILKIAERQRSRFSRVFAYSAASIFFFHFGINIAMTIGLAPVIGIPLPFISYGGSSLWSFTLILFTLLRLDLSRDELL